MRAVGLDRMGPKWQTPRQWNNRHQEGQRRPGKILVATLRMVPERITREWLLS
jgi:hypothetical protein